MEKTVELAPYEKQEKYTSHLLAIEALPHVLEAIVAIQKTKRWPSTSSRNKLGSLKNDLNALRNAVETCILNDEDAKTLKNELAVIYG